MSKYHRLALEERYQIKALKQSGLSIRQISTQLGRSPSTISRELRRNKGWSYYPKRAQAKAVLRRRGIGPPKKIRGRLARRVEKYLKKQWSPEQIVGRMPELNISHETIYKYIYTDFVSGGALYLQLRRRRKRRRSRQVSTNYKNVGKRSYTNWIAKRPKIVDKRMRIGDFERDSVLGKFNGPVLLTIVDRTSRLIKVTKLNKINAMLTHRATVRLLKGLPVKTITNDNGPEFSYYDLTEKALKADVYFNDPYCSWQRGTNENTNGLIRQYYPKGTDFSKVTKREIKALENKLNNRPRKCLGYKTPLEVHKELNQGVALST